MSSGPDLPKGYIGLNLGAQDPRGYGRRGVGQWCPALPFKFCAPHFMFGSPNYHEAVELLCAVDGQ